MTGRRGRVGRSATRGGRSSLPKKQIPAQPPPVEPDSVPPILLPTAGDVGIPAIHVDNRAVDEPRDDDGRSDGKDVLLRDIPKTERKRAQGWKKGFTRSPIKTRSRCRLENSDRRPEDKEDESSDDGGDAPSFPSPSPPPSPSRLLSSSKDTPAASTTATAGTSDRTEEQGGHKGTKTRIVDRPFCTQKCLSGLASGDGPMDDRCPNFPDHQRRHHINNLAEFLGLLRDQLARDRGYDADATPLYLSGSIWALFKVRLSSHGYTLVAKGVEDDHLARLQHEKRVYDQLRTIQGKHVPVCLGMVDLVLPYYYDGGVFTSFLFLSWAGRPLLFDLPRQADDRTRTAIVDAVSVGLKAVHSLHVLHGDAEPRNIVYDADNGHVMIVDFERSKLLSRDPLGLISLNRKGKRNNNMRQEKQREDYFAAELESITRGVKG